MFRRNQTKLLHTAKAKTTSKIKTRMISWNILAFWIFFWVFFLIQNTAQASIQVTNKLQSLYTQIKENPWLDKLPWWNSMSNLYETALKTVKEEDILPLQEAITQVTLDLNKQYTCNLLDSDITNILLYTDDKLRKQTEMLLTKPNQNNDEDTIHIDYQDLDSACNTLIQCKEGTNSKAPHLNCQRIVYNSFLIHQKSIRESDTMKTWIFGTNFFQNANKDDSIFDLLIDVEAIGNVLFEWFKSSETAQVLFYRMPERNKTGEWGWDNVEPGDPDFPAFPNANNDINRYDIWWGAYPKAWFNCPENIEAATNSFDPPFINTWTNWENNINPTLWGSWATTGSWENWEKKENKTNGKNTNNKQNNLSANYINWVWMIWNACIQPEEEAIEPIVETWTTTTWITIPPTYECGNAIIEWNEQCDDGNNDNTDNCLNSCLINICGDGYIETNHEQCDDGNLDNWDGCNSLCRQEESPYCGDWIIQTDRWEQCDDGNNSNNDSCLNNCKKAICGDGYIEVNKEQCDDGNTTSFDCCDNQCQNEWFLSAEDMALWDMLASFNKLNLTQWPKITEGCFQDCEWLPIADRVLCMVDCTCGEIPSPAIWDTIDAWAFRIKYCMIPAESVEVISKWKTIFSIEEIFTAIKSLLLWLKDSWEILKSVESKELMESSMIKNDFGKMFAFNIAFNFKSLNGGVKNNAVETEKAIQQNKNFMVWISNLWDTKSFPKQRNKYVVIADIPTAKARQKDNKNIEALQAEITTERENFDKKISMGGIVTWDPLTKKTAIENSLMNKRTTLMAEEFMTFLNMNHAFWKNMNQMFEDIYAATSLLRTKIEN